jgi:hypothetical protein
MIIGMHAKFDEAQEIMERWVAERDHPSGFLV